MRSILNPRSGPAGDSTATIEMTDSNSNISALSTHTFTSMSLGDTADDRVTIIAISATRTTVTAMLTYTVTVGGVSARRVGFKRDSSTRATVELWAVPSGTGSSLSADTTANVVLSFNGSCYVYGVAVYRMTNALSHSAHSIDWDDAGNPLDADVFVHAGGVAAAVHHNNYSGGSPTTVTGTTKDVEEYSGGAVFSSDEFDTEQDTLTIEHTLPSTTDHCMFAGAWAPKDDTVTLPFEESFYNNGDSSKYFSRTFSSPTDAKRFCWGGWMWVEDTGAGGTYMLTSYGAQSDAGSFFNYRSGSDKIQLTGWYTIWYTSSESIGTGWHHIVMSMDTYQATGAERFEVWLDGTKLTNTRSGPSLNQTFRGNSAVSHQFGRYAYTGGNAWQGGWAQFFFIDGESIQNGNFAASDFYTTEGGVMLPKDISSVPSSWGNNGALLDFADAADMGNDISGNANDWTANGSPHQNYYIPRMTV